MELTVLQLESSIISVPTYLASAYLKGSYQCGAIMNNFDANDPPAQIVDYITRIDRCFVLLTAIPEKSWYMSV